MKTPEYLYLDFLQECAVYMEYDDPCTAEEVDELERSLGIKFPRAYRELVMIFGKYSSFTIAENSFEYPEYQGMRDAAIEMAAGDDMVKIDENIFVFNFDFHGPSAAWFPLNAGDDPPVYEYASVNEKTGFKVAEHFSAYIRMLPWYQGFLSIKERRAKK
ncbi:SMI1/KNR4 family protein [Chitinophaga pinensis]|uniref:Knr4/Smi1-like domain-containing protein n=1 Tax=Chitinophaga pinensis (strain ATCC 43595 / DSM 2588 / LMG 13176 / NBRC 15968 / NCIMB 11800 / UQM 2034) TaxID=485918 RepID=A0A979G3Z7_CHIPD|nr:SMI1/KNR4 family protein [Chitinophaga pinensis]ACU60256.1 hypothetical protein Cpin_2777 [Chitinophaga pinensis DSM 2588]